MKAVLFDLDGTLVDTSQGILESVDYTIRHLGLPSLSEQVMLEFVGPPIQNSLMRFAGITAEQAQYGANVFRDYYKSTSLLHAKVYDGIFCLLDYLWERNIKIGVATYKREDYALTLLRYLGIASYCEVIHGADNENKLTKTDIVNLCCEELRCDRSGIILVGDTHHDAEGAQKAGVGFIAVTWGFGYKEDSFIPYPCMYVANNPLEIKSWLLDSLLSRYE